MTREVLYAEVLIQVILSACTIDLDEMEANLKKEKMVKTTQHCLAKANGNPETAGKTQ